MQLEEEIKLTQLQSSQTKIVNKLRPLQKRGVFLYLLM